MHPSTASRPSPRPRLLRSRASFVTRADDDHGRGDGAGTLGHGDRKPMSVAAFFDMDNTLLTVDTGTSWTRFLYRRGELPPMMVAKVLYWSTLYKLAVLDMESVFTRLCLDLRG